MACPFGGRFSGCLKTFGQSAVHRLILIFAHSPFCLRLSVSAGSLKRQSGWEKGSLKSGNSAFRLPFVRD
nr:hypothetical protein [uncultured Kingella sp.]